MRFDVWVDNAIYKNRQKFFQHINKTTTIDIDSLRIYKLDEPYVPDASKLCKLLIPNKIEVVSKIRTVH